MIKMKDNSEGRHIMVLEFAFDVLGLAGLTTGGLQAFLLDPLIEPYWWRQVLCDAGLTQYCL